MLSENQDRSNSSKTVLTYGTFDLFHIGHLRLLRRQKELGSRLIVGVSTDEFNEKKGKKTVIPFSQRVEILQAISYVDLVIAEETWEQKIDDIKNYNVDLFVMGDDWKNKFDDLKEYCEVRYLPRTECVSSTAIKEALQSIYGLRMDEMSIQFKILKQILEELK